MQIKHRQFRICKIYVLLGKNQPTIAEIVQKQPFFALKRGTEMVSLPSSPKSVHNIVA
jgi:hypothetical protein